MRFLIDKKTWWLLVIVPLILLVIFNIWPLINLFILAFTYQGEFTLGNFAYIFNDPVFLQALQNTFVYGFVITPITIILSFVTALLLKTKLNYKNWLEKFFFLPYITSTIAIGVVWKYFLNADYGLINQFLMLLHLQPIEFLTSSEWARFSVCLFTIWKSLALNILFYLIAIRSLNKNVLEAAKIDGANTWQEIRFIVIPLTMKTTTFLFFVNFITNFKIYNEIVALFGPQSAGIANSAISIVYYIYNMLYINVDFNLAAAAGIVLLCLVAFLIYIQSKFMKWVSK